MAWCSVTPSNNKPSLLFSKKKLRTLAASLCLLEVGFEEAVWPTFMMFLETVPRISQLESSGHTSSAFHSGCG